MLKEFKKFAMRGNVMDMAIGIILGAAFGRIVASFVKDVVMPPIGLALGGVSFENLYINLSDKVYETLEAAEKAGAPLVKYGAFINTVIDFLIVAFVIFLVVRTMNKLKKEEPKEETTKDCPHCTMSIGIKATRCPHCTSELEAA